jgi:SOS response regulatory protein OraA/RecX
VRCVIAIAPRARSSGFSRAAAWARATARRSSRSSCARPSVDDRRYAESRALTLAERGAGNERIRYELAFAGIDDEVAEDVIGLLDSEAERAGRIIERRGASPKTARYLAGKGFSEDVVHAVVAHARDETLG